MPATRRRFGIDAAENAGAARERTGSLPPAEFEMRYPQQQTGSAMSG